MSNLSCFGVQATASAAQQPYQNIYKIVSLTGQDPARTILTHSFQNKTVPLSNNSYNIVVPAGLYEIRWCASGSFVNPGAWRCSLLSATNDQPVTGSTCFGSAVNAGDAFNVSFSTLVTITATVSEFYLAFYNCTDLNGQSDNMGWIWIKQIK